MPTRQSRYYFRFTDEEPCREVVETPAFLPEFRSDAMLLGPPGTALTLKDPCYFCPQETGSPRQSPLIWSQSRLHHQDIPEQLPSKFLLPTSKYWGTFYPCLCPRSPSSTPPPPFILLLFYSAGHPHLVISNAQLISAPDAGGSERWQCLIDVITCTL